MTIKIKQPQVITKTVSPIDDEKMEHPAQGCVEVSKPMGGSRQLFGSDLKHSTTVCLRVSTATGYRGLHSDRHHADKMVCEFEFSEAQWAQFVSSIGMGNGVPCTFNYRPTQYKLERMPEIVKEPLAEKFQRDIEETTVKYVADIKTLVDRLDTLLKSGSQKGIREMVRDLQIKLENLPRNMGFLQGQLTEAVENAVSAGKVEVEAFARNTLMRAGMEHFAEKSAPRLNVADEVKSLPKGDSKK